MDTINDTTAPTPMRTLVARALQQHRPELWEEWSEEGTIEEHLDRLTAIATVIADSPSSTPGPEEILVRQGAPSLVRAWAALVAANSATLQDQEAARQAKAEMVEQ